MAPVDLAAPTAEIVRLKEIEVPAAHGSGYARFFVEDGWVFREHHGKHVECICRSENADLSDLSRAAVGRLRA